MSTLPLATTPTDRERIVAAAQVLYLQHGISAVSVADLAHHLDLLESRITDLFPNKEPLVWAVVNELSYGLHDKLSQYKERSSNAIEELLALHSFFVEQADRQDSPFFQELANDYPACQGRWHMHLTGFPAEQLRHNFRWGMLQELYHPQEVEVLVQQVFEQGSRPVGNLLLHLLARIVTPAGALQVQRLTGSPSAA